MADDLKAAFRSLRSSKTFTAVALIVLALGIGATTAIFSVVDAVVLRGLPFDEHDRLVAVGERRPPGPNAGSESRSRCRSAARPAELPRLGRAAAGVRIDRRHRRRRGHAARAGAEPEDLRAQRVTADVLRRAARPSRRSARRSRGERSRRPPPVVVLSDGLWRRRFGGDPAIVGKTMPLEGGSLGGGRRDAAGFRVPGRRRAADRSVGAVRRPAERAHRGIPARAAITCRRSRG